MGGLFLDVKINSSVAVEPEILYSMKGSDFSGTDTTIALNYIEVPILVKYSFHPEGGMYLLAGPTVNFDVGSDVPGIPTTSGPPVTLSPNLTFGGIVGLGYLRGHVGLEGRYDFDFLGRAGAGFVHQPRREEPRLGDSRPGVAIGDAEGHS